MEAQSHPPSSLPVLPLHSAKKGFLFPDTPPLTPAMEATTPRTPRKPAHPQHTSLCINRGNSAIISFKLQLNNHQESPSLQITSTTPSKRVSTARRRLWSQSGEVCEPFSLDTDHKGQDLLRARPSPKTPVYMDGIDADDEMEGPSPVSCFYSSPYYEESISERATKPSSSAYPFLSQNIEKKSSHFISPKIRSSSSKTKTCASCKTKKTPLWRDAEDGTPYCNACGIRFKKYRFRCSSCSYIPRKDEREMNKCCCLCGSRLVHCKISGRY